MKDNVIKRNKDKKIAVLIPCYNEAKTIEKAKSINEVSNEYFSASLQ